MIAFCELVGEPGTTAPISTEFLDATNLAKHTNPELNFPLLPSPQKHWADRLRECNQKFHALWIEFKEHADNYLQRTVKDDWKAKTTTSFHLQDSSSPVYQLKNVKAILDLSLQKGVNYLCIDKRNERMVTRVGNIRDRLSSGKITEETIRKLTGKCKMTLFYSEKSTFPIQASQIPFSILTIKGKVLIPADIGKFSIQELVIETDQTPPKEIWEVQNLHTLSISNESLEGHPLQVPFPTKQLPELKELTLSGRIPIADFDLRMFPNLTSLNLSHKNLEVGILQHINLKKLRLAYCKLEALPKGFLDKLPALEVLEIPFNKFSALPLYFWEGDVAKTVKIDTDGNPLGFFNGSDYFSSILVNDIKPSGYHRVDDSWDIKKQFINFVREKKEAWKKEGWDTKGQDEKKDMPLLFQRLEEWFMLDDEPKTRVARVARVAQTSV